MSTETRFSHLRAYGRSAMHGKYAVENDAEETRDMERGTAVHALVFGTRRVVGYPGPVRRGKEYEAFCAMNTDAEILTLSEYEKSRNMAEAVRASSVAAPYLVGVYEETIRFRWMGVDCRATPDVRGDGFITELKSSSSSAPEKFLWHARRMAYHAQMRFQGYACESAKHTVKDNWIVCVESEPPHPVTVFHVEPEALEEGDKLLTLWVERMKNSIASDTYPAYIDCPVPLVWPKEEEFVYGD